MVGILKTEEETRLDGIIHDAEKELKSLRVELGKYRSMFDSARLIVGHEFIKPLTSINGYMELLEDNLEGRLGEKEKNYLSRIHDSVGHLGELVESVIQMLRFEKGDGEVKALEKVDVPILIEGVVQRFGEHAGLIRVHVEGELPKLFLRRRCLDVVLENLLSNAIKHSGNESPVMVNVSLARERRGASREILLVVSIEDRGVGIPEDKIEEIFEPFCRLGDGDMSGLGLGLALVKSIITIMEGDIHVRSKSGEGTTVTITVPALGETGTFPDRIG